MTAARSRKSKPRPEDLGKRLDALITGLTVARVLKADEREVVIEFADGTRLFVRADQHLDVSVTS